MNGRIHKSFNSRLSHAEEIISGLEDRAFGIIQSEKHKRKRHEKPLKEKISTSWEFQGEKTKRKRQSTLKARSENFQTCGGNSHTDS